MDNQTVVELFGILLGIYFFSVLMFGAEKLSPHLPDFIAKHSMLAGIIPVYNTALALVGFVNILKRYFKRK